ncbi:MAG: wax ester/triacylglycerol synthase family O-acyltransferase [Actinomycetia bacterium]|nr:wax ester/triacylglycerol synthase family O-acyltransferase [Actinomycetes bacterium]
MPTEVKREVAAVDGLWLHMDTPENLMVIEGIMMFDDALDVERAIDVLRVRLPERYPVFKQKPVASRNPVGGDYWVSDPDFDIHDHIVFADLGAGGDDADLQEYVSAQMSRPLDKTRPLWEVHFISNYLRGTAVLARFHHAMADGTALARVLLELTDDNPDDDLAEAENLKAPGAVNEGQRHNLLGISRRVDSLIGGEPDGMRQRLLGQVDKIDEAAGTAKDSLAHKAMSGAHSVEKLASFDTVTDVWSVAKLAPTLVDKLFVTKLPASPVRGKAGVRKAAVWSKALDLNTIKAVSKAHGATVNDVMIAALAGAIRAYTLDHGGEPTDMSTMVPVNLRPLDRPLPRELGNKFALVVLKLPISGESPEERLALTKAGMDKIKGSAEAMVTFGIIEGLGSFNAAMTQNLVGFFSSKGIGVTTNVIGPMQPRYFAGTRVQSVLGWAPSAGDQTINECIFSCDGKIRVGFKVDYDTVPDAQRLVDAFDDELKALAASAI